MLLVICAVERSGGRLAEAVAEWFVELLPELVVDTVVLDSGDRTTPPDALARIPAGAAGAVLCTTPGSLSEVRLAFALGLLHGSVGNAGFVAPLLLDLLPGDIARTPLAVFQVTPAHRAEVNALVLDVQARLGVMPAATVQRRFDAGWERFSDRVRWIPGLEVTPFAVSVASLQGIAHFRFDPGSTDASWEESLGEVLATLPGSPLGVPLSDGAGLAALDVEASRWIEVPALLSRLQTSHLALVDVTLVDQWQGDARFGARQIRESLPPKGITDKVIWSPKHVVLARSVR